MWIPGVALMTGLIHDYVPAWGLITFVFVAGTEATVKYKTGLYLHEWLNMVIVSKTGYSLSQILKGQFHEKTTRSQRSDGYHQITYTYQNKPYHLVWPIQTSHVLRIECHDEDHVDKQHCQPQLMAFLGPCRDFHGMALTPNLMNHRAIEVEYYSSHHDDPITTHIFHEDTVIPLSVDS